MGAPIVTSHLLVVLSCAGLFKSAVQSASTCTPQWRASRRPGSPLKTGAGPGAEQIAQRPHGTMVISVQHRADLFGLCPLEAPTLHAKPRLPVHQALTTPRDGDHPPPRRTHLERRKVQGTSLASRLPPPCAVRRRQRLQIAVCAVTCLPAKTPLSVSPSAIPPRRRGASARPGMHSRGAAADRCGKSQDAHAPAAGGAGQSDQPCQTCHSLVQRGEVTSPGFTRKRAAIVVSLAGDPTWAWGLSEEIPQMTSLCRAFAFPSLRRRYNLMTLNR